MRHFLKILAVLAPLAPAAALAAADGGQQEFLAAAQTFEKLKAEAMAKGDMPRLSDPRVRKTLGILSSKSRTFGSASFPERQSLCSVPIKVSLAYQLFGFEKLLKEKGFSPASDPRTIAAASLELQARNIARFQDETYPLLAFSVRCFAAGLPLLTAFMEKLPPEQVTDIRLEGLAKMRFGLKQMVASNIASLHCEGLREENQLLLFDALTRALPAFSGVLPVAERAQLRDAVQEMRANVPEAYRPATEAMLTALSDTRCQGLCRF